MDDGRKLRIIFMGTPVFAVPVISALLEEGYEIVGVYTQIDRPAGRKGRIMPSAVKAFSLDCGLPLFQTSSLKSDQKAREEMESLSPDLIVVAAYGLFLPVETLNLPRLGALNVHPSLLPKYRGPSPVPSTILNGDITTGVTIMKLDEGMDSGPIVAQEKTSLYSDETAEFLTTRLFKMGSNLLTKILPLWERGEIKVRPQDESQVTVTKLLSREDGKMEWELPAICLARQVRAYYPWPGCFTYWGGSLLKVVEASHLESGDQPIALSGEVVPLGEGRVGVGTGSGILEVTQLQLSGRRRVSSTEFTQGYPDIIGSILGQ